VVTISWHKHSLASSTIAEPTVTRILRATLAKAIRIKAPVQPIPSQVASRITPQISEVAHNTTILETYRTISSPVSTPLRMEIATVNNPT